MSTSALLETSFDLAAWFMDRALNENEYLQPQKLHRLMYLSQGYYALAHHGRPLIPAVFVAGELGPLEPAVYRAFERGRPDINMTVDFPPQVDQFLDGMWRRFGNHSTEHLNRLVSRNKAYKFAFGKGVRTLIPLEYISRSLEKDKEAPKVDQVMRPKPVRTQTGRPVHVKAWAPALKKVAPDPDNFLTHKAENKKKSPTPSRG